jgi:hypothetical protein
VIAKREAAATKHFSGKISRAYGIAVARNGVCGQERGIDGRRGGILIGI